MIKLQSAKKKCGHHLSRDGISALCGRRASWLIVSDSGALGRCCSTCTTVAELEINPPRCAQPECDRPRYCKGLCELHYARAKNGGDMDAPPRDDSPTDHLVHEAAAHIGDDCYLWSRGFSGAGYGMTRFEGKYQHAHRAVCRLAHGEPPTSKHDAAHSCGNRACVNPRHLRWATRAENFGDMVAHGTRHFGEASHKSKLTEAQAREILALRGISGCRVLAPRYGVCMNTISDIQHRRTWKHL